MATAATSLPVKAKLRENEHTESPFWVVVRRFSRHRMAVISLIFIVMMLVVSLLAPVIAFYPRDAQDIAAPSRPAPPGISGSEGKVHILGIDHLGRDLFTRVLYGGRISLTIALIVTLLAESIGVVIGAVAGPIQAAGRTLLVRVSPPERVTQFFGLYALSGKVTSFVGPLAVGALTAYSGSQRIGISILLLFFVAGSLILLGVSEDG